MTQNNKGPETFERKGINQASHWAHVQAETLLLCLVKFWLLYWKSFTHT